jgi:hypothetical protein
MTENKPQTTKEWDDNTTQSWLDAVEAWPWEHNEDLTEWRKAGPCPRCEDPMDCVLILGHGPFFGPPEFPDEISIACNCVSDHLNRPAAQKTGCGQAGKGFSPPSRGAK